MGIFKIISGNFYVIERDIITGATYWEGWRTIFFSFLLVQQSPRYSGLCRTSKHTCKMERNRAKIRKYSFLSLEVDSVDEGLFMQNVCSGKFKRALEY